MFSGPGKPGPDPTFPTNVVSGSDREMDDLRVAAVTNPQSTPDQLETMLRRLLAGTAVPAVPRLEQLLQRLLVGTPARQPVPAVWLGALSWKLCSNFAFRESDTSTATLTGPIRQDWATVVCFSCGKTGHSATHCPALNESFPFMLPEWKAEKEWGSYVMISPRLTENGD